MSIEIGDLKWVNINGHFQPVKVLGPSKVFGTGTYRGKLLYRAANMFGTQMIQVFAEAELLNEREKDQAQEVQTQNLRYTPQARAVKEPPRFQFHEDGKEISRQEWLQKAGRFSVRAALQEIEDCLRQISKETGKRTGVRIENEEGSFIEIDCIEGRTFAIREHDREGFEKKAEAGEEAKEELLPWEGRSTEGVEKHRSEAWENDYRTFDTTETEEEPIPPTDPAGSASY